MSDPIERMQRLRSDVEGGPMLPAAEVRRRGDRIRRRRTLAVTAGTALAVVAIVAPVAVLTTGSTSDDDPLPPADSTSLPPSESSPEDTAEPDDAGILSEGNLLTDDDTEYHQFDETFDGWQFGGTFAGDGQAPPNPCQGDSMPGLGAETVFQREWHLEGVQGLNQTIAEFPSEAGASTAYQELTGWFDDCAPAESVGYDDATSSAVTIPVDGKAQLVDATFAYPDREEGGEAYADQRLITGIAVSGDRLTMLTHVMPDSDYDEWWTTPPVERMLPTAAQRMVEQHDPVNAETAIPDDFPLSGGWPDDDGAEVSTEGPNRTLPPLDHQACAVTLEPALAPMDRLRANYSAPEDYRGRELATYATVDDAASALEEVLEFYRQCPEGEVRDDGMVANTEVSEFFAGDESWVITERDTFDGEQTPFGATTVLVRVGSAVLTLTYDGHAGTTGDAEAMTNLAISEVADVIDAMCQFSANGC